MRSSLPLAAGIICGKLVMLTTAVLGLAMLLHVLGPAFALLKWAGVGYLLWLGINKWRKAGQPLARRKPAWASRRWSSAWAWP
jgi:threonine/homoserine/homoserine lactone efflux protein